MKILCFIDSLGSGGAQRQMVELAIGFKEKGHDVAFLVYHKINFFKSKLDENEIPVFTILENNYVKRLFKVRKFIRNYNASSILSFLEAANFMAIIAGFPFRNWQIIVGERSTNPTILKNFKLIFYRFFHIFADYVVANSNKNLQLVKKVNPLISNNKMCVIYNSVKIPGQSYPLSKKTYTNIVIAASYRAVKNLDNLIKAVYLLDDSYTSKLKINWYGDISMDKIYFKKNLNEIKKLGLEKVFSLNDKTSRINKKYLEADFVALFSHYEGFPNAICEGMAMGRPIIVTKVSDVPTLINENSNGYLCESQDINSIKKALIKAINSTQKERDKMGENNFLLSKKEFNKKIIVEQYLKLLDNEKYKNNR